MKVGTKDLVANSTHIFLGKVQKLEYFKLDKSKKIFTKITILPEKIIKGKITSTEVEIYNPGGTLGGITLRVSDSPNFIVGENIIVYCQLQKKGYYKIFSGNQGKVTIINKS